MIRKNTYKPKTSESCNIRNYVAQDSQLWVAIENSIGEITRDEFFVQIKAHFLGSHYRRFGGKS